MPLLASQQTWLCREFLIRSVWPGRGTTAERLAGPSEYLFIVRRSTKKPSARSRMPHPMRTTRLIRSELDIGHRSPELTAHRQRFNRIPPTAAV